MVNVHGWQHHWNTDWHGPYRAKGMVGLEPKASLRLLGRGHCQDHRAGTHGVLGRLVPLESGRAQTTQERGRELWETGEAWMPLKSGWVQMPLDMGMLRALPPNISLNLCYPLCGKKTFACKSPSVWVTAYQQMYLHKYLRSMSRRECNRCTRT